MQYMLLDVIIAYFIDLLVGDPYRLPHPVRYIGKLVRNTEAFLRARIDRASNKAAITGVGFNRAVAERRAGIFLTVFVAGATFLTVLLTVKATGLIHPALFHVFNIYFIYSALAVKCLADEAKKVQGVLKTGDVAASRKAVSMLVGRETDKLSEQEIIRATVETTAENTVDGAISPIAYAVLGSLFGLGAPLVYAFKAISTMDSMVGYMNERYIHFGRCAAKTDDAANYLPARLSGIIMPAAAMLCGMSFKKSFTVMLRDRRNHKSPNCAYPEAAVAGALGVRLGGANVYFGKVVEKPTIGDAGREIESEDILRAVRILYAASALTLILCLGIAIALRGLL